ncbi:MAG TPA: hypothetical protein VHY91_26505 [Pirellulales bacterium]|jgi:hypothetical protein|nr:hypothetical protein [Pirellulales bacterium]
MGDVRSETRRVKARAEEWARWREQRRSEILEHKLRWAIAEKIASRRQFERIDSGNALRGEAPHGRELLGRHGAAGPRA